MKLSEVRPCDKCGGKIAPHFYIVDVSMALFTPATNQVLGMTQYFNGHLPLAEMFVGEPDVILVMGDEDPKLKTRIFLCQDCAIMSGEGIDLASLMQKVTDRLREIEEKKAEREKEV